MPPYSLSAYIFEYFFKFLVKMTIVLECIPISYDWVYEAMIYTVPSTNIGTLGKYEQRRLWK